MRSIADSNGNGYLHRQPEQLVLCDLPVCHNPYATVFTHFKMRTVDHAGFCRVIRTLSRRKRELLKEAPTVTRLIEISVMRFHFPVLHNVRTLCQLCLVCFDHLFFNSIELPRRSSSACSASRRAFSAAC